MDSGDGIVADQFPSLDDLVVFGMTHELRVAGEEVHLNCSVPCRDKPYQHMLLPVKSGKADMTLQCIFCSLTHVVSPYAGQKGRLLQEEDCDMLTDLFAAVFGSHCAVSNALY